MGAADELFDSTRAYLFTRCLPPTRRLAVGQFDRDNIDRWLAARPLRVWPTAACTL